MEASRAPTAPLCSWEAHAPDDLLPRPRAQQPGSSLEARRWPLRPRRPACGPDSYPTLRPMPRPMVDLAVPTPQSPRPQPWHPLAPPSHLRGREHDPELAQLRACCRGLRAPCLLRALPAEAMSFHWPPVSPDPGPRYASARLLRDSSCGWKSRLRCSRLHQWIDCPASLCALRHPPGCCHVSADLWRVVECRCSPYHQGRRLLETPSMRLHPNSHSGSAAVLAPCLKTTSLPTHWALWDLLPHLPVHALVMLSSLPWLLHQRTA
mmetsp:Transcript_54258/g.173942  ORF Transcript_54258/g.173942 Transcript_54258/m.173942 type:complete len:265 (-) Transcript_54258:430-1224(-)